MHKRLSTRNTTEPNFIYVDNSKVRAAQCKKKKLFLFLNLHLKCHAGTIYITKFYYFDEYNVEVTHHKN